MKKLLFYLLLACFSLPALAQEDRAEIKKQINKIKKSQAYVSAEATMPTEAEAMEMANQLLVFEINNWLQSKRKSDEVQQVVLQDISSCKETLDMKRGTQVRAFVYVKKKDIVLIKGDGQIVLNENEQGTDLQPLSEITEPMHTNASQVEPLQVVQAQPAESGLERIAGTATMMEMKGVFADLKAKGAIEYGEYRPDVPVQDVYLLFYDRQGTVRAVVQKKGEALTNVKSRESMTLNDFDGCAAYWFTLK
ncbi:hypothetical protein [Phocaeicola sp.]|uniref:hypothetical protein n=1 Tax=Phocaeicola sp. TaxID=2773926 RepID=UPI00307B8A2D